MTWRDALLILGPILAYAASRASSRQSDKASQRSKKASDDATAVERERLGLDTLEKSLDEQERRIERLTTDLRDEQATRQKAEDRVTRLAGSLAAHGQWDLLVLAEVRKFTPDFPDPPRLVMDDR